MKTSQLLFITVFLVCLLLSSQMYAEHSIEFEHDQWAAIKKKAREEKKLIFIDAYASWCGPCKWMSKNVFTNDTVAEFYNANFINAKFDMEKGEGKQLAELYEVKAYPSLLFVNGNGELIHRGCGARKSQDFIQLGKDALDPEKQFGTYLSKYESGKRDGKFISDYLDMLNSACLGTEEVVTAYFDTQKKDDYLSRTNWEIINKADIKMDTRVFNYLVNNKDKFYNAYGYDSVDQKIFNVYWSGLHKIIYAKEFDEDAFAKMKKEVIKADFGRGEELNLLADNVYYEKNKDWDNYAKVAVKYIEKYKTDDYNVLNNTAWAFYENVDDKQMLEKALEWAKISVELNDQSFNNDTYAALLYKVGEYDKALKVEEKALQMAKNAGDATESYEDMLKKIRAAKAGD